MHSLILPFNFCMWPLKTLRPILALIPLHRQAMDGPIKTTNKLHLKSYNSITLLQNLKDQILTTNVWIEHVSFEIILIKVRKSKKLINSTKNRTKNYYSELFFSLENTQDSDFLFVFRENWGHHNLLLRLSDL